MYSMGLSSEFGRLFPSLACHLHAKIRVFNVVLLLIVRHNNLHNFTRTHGRALENQVHHTRGAAVVLLLFRQRVSLCFVGLQASVWTGGSPANSSPWDFASEDIAVYCVRWICMKTTTSQIVNNCRVSTMKQGKGVGVWSEFVAKNCGRYVVQYCIRWTEWLLHVCAQILRWAKSELKDGNSVVMTVLWKHTFANDDHR